MVNKTGLLAVVLAVTLAGSAVTAAVVVQEQQQAGNEMETEMQSQSLVSVVHASPDAPAVDVSVDNETVAENVSFGDATEYTYLSAGTYNVTVTVADGAAQEDGETPTATPTEEGTATPGEATPAEDGTATPGEATPTEEGTVTPGEATPTEDGTATPGEEETPGEATPGEETPGEATPDEETPGEATPGEETPGEATPGEATPTEEGTATPGEATPTEENMTETPAAATPTETPGAEAEDDATEGEVVYEATVTLGERNVTTFVAHGETTEGAATEFQLTQVSDDAWTPTEENAALRVAHFSPDAPTVDLTVANDSTVLAENVSYANTTGYMTVPAGDYTVEVREAADDNNGSVITTVDLSLESEEAYTAWAAGYATPEEAPGNESFQTFLTQDASATIEVPGADAAPPTPEGTETPGEEETPDEETPGEATPGEATPSPEGTEAPGVTETPDDATEAPGEEGTETPAEEA